jgi:hypothetical protein
MANEVGVFLNLEPGSPAQGESHDRLQTLFNNLPTNTIAGTVYGGGDTDGGTTYRNRAHDLVTVKARNAKVYFASCWPSLKALNDELNSLASTAAIVYGGLAVADGTAVYNRSTGISAFGVANLCPNWPALLKQLNVNTVTIVYDSNPNHPGPISQYTAASNAATALNMTVKTLHADINTGGVITINTNIDNDIMNNTNAGEGLIVTACTFTGVLREKIVSAAYRKGLLSIFADEMYIGRTNRTNRGLMSFGPNVLDLYADATSYVRRLIQSNNPANDAQNTIMYPRVINSSFYLTINRTTADYLNLSLPLQFTVTVNGNAQ